jgi:hypothetical protein
LFVYNLAPSSGTPKGESKVDGSEDDDIAVLSRRISQAALSDDSSVSAVDNNYDSDASRDVSSMAEGDMADMEDNDITTSVLDEEKRDHNNTKISHRKGLLFIVLYVITSCITSPLRSSHSHT